MILLILGQQPVRNNIQTSCCSVSWKGLAPDLCVAEIICAAPCQQYGGYPPLTHLLENSRMVNWFIFSVSPAFNPLLTLFYPLHTKFCSGNIHIHLIFWG